MLATVIWLVRSTVKHFLLKEKSPDCSKGFHKQFKPARRVMVVDSAPKIRVRILGVHHGSLPFDTAK